MATKKTRTRRRTRTHTFYSGGYYYASYADTQLAADLFELVDGINDQYGLDQESAYGGSGQDSGYDGGSSDSGSYGGDSGGSF